MTQRTKNRKMRKVTASKQTEVAYRREVNSILKHMLNIALDDVRSVEVADRIDWLRSMTRVNSSINAKLDNIDFEDLAQRVARRIVGKTAAINAKRFSESADKTIGIDLKGFLTRSTPEVLDFLEISTQYNASLIKSISAEFHQEISKTIMDNVYAGERSTNLITQLMDRYHVSESKAKFLARDQTSKMNGDLTRVRAEAIGAKTYIWSGSLDERERESHRVMEGKLCKYSDPTVYSDDGGKTWKKRKAIKGVELHPSQDYRCRCVGRAVVNFE